MYLVIRLQEEFANHNPAFHLRERRNPIKLIERNKTGRETVRILE